MFPRNLGDRAKRTPAPATPDIGNRLFLQKTGIASRSEGPALPWFRQRPSSLSELIDARFAHSENRLNVDMLPKGTYHGGSGLYRPRGIANAKMSPQFSAKTIL